MKSVTIYLNKEKTAFKVVKPSTEFNGDWKGLVDGVTNGFYHSFKVF
ncbi:hypothetical protein [Chryseobacterium sp. KCF3-3]